jgi:hypothetical protein
MLIMSIPVISPIDLSPAQSSTKLLPAPEETEVEEVPAEGEEPDYTVQEVEYPPPPAFIASPALMALNEIEQALEVQEYHDFGWWKKRLNVLREAIKPPRTTNVSA